MLFEVKLGSASLFKTWSYPETEEVAEKQRFRKHGYTCIKQAVAYFLQDGFYRVISLGI